MSARSHQETERGLGLACVFVPLFLDPRNGDVLNFDVAERVRLQKPLVAHDPLRLRFDGEILDVRIKRVSREVLRITAATSEEVRSVVCFDFEFLDSDDGGVVEVLHTGSTKAPECTGTIMGLPRGPQRLAPAFDTTLTPSKWRLIGDTIMFSFLGTVLSSAGLMVVVVGIYQEGLIRALIGLVLLVVGGAMVVVSVWDAWINRVPSSLYL